MRFFRPIFEELILLLRRLNFVVTWIVRLYNFILFNTNWTNVECDIDKTTNPLVLPEIFFPQYIFDLICFWLKDSHRILISIQCNKLATILNMCWSICKATACKLFKLLEFFNDAKKHRNSCLVFYRINCIALKHFAITRISFVMSLSNNIFMHYKSKKD